MQEWEKKFDSLALSRGKNLYQDRKIEHLKEADGRVTATITGAPVYEVSMYMANGVPTRLRCQCPKYRRGSNCEHMAAVLYAREAEAEQEAAKQTERIIAQAAREATDRALEEARRIAEEEEAAREKRRKEVAERIAQREAEKRMQKAERKKRHEEAAAAEKLRQEQEKKRQEELQAQLEQRREEERLRQEELRKQEQQRRQEEERRRIEEKQLQKERMLREKEIQKTEEKTEYGYYEYDTLRNNLKLTEDLMNKGYRIYKKGEISLDQVDEGFISENGEPVLDISATGKEKNVSFPVRIMHGRERFYTIDCQCSKCGRYYGWYYRDSNSRCPYTAALLYAAEDYVRSHHIGDATNHTGSGILFGYRTSHTRAIMAESAEKKTLTLEPRVQRNGDELRLSFRVGESKLFVIKDLMEFCRLVRNSASGTYGSNTQIMHRLDDFTPEGKEWYEFISKAVKEEEELQRRLEDELGYGGRQRKCSYIALYGWRLDQFYEKLCGQPVAYEDKSVEGKKKSTLSASEADPHIQMHIDKIRWRDVNPSQQSSWRKTSFHGITVTCRLPVFFDGVNTSYYIEDDSLKKAGQEAMAAIRPLVSRAQDGQLEFQVGRRSLTEFYYEVLPQLAEYAEVTETDAAQEIHSYLTPEARFVFYLDADRGNMFCRISAFYEEKEENVLDGLQQDKIIPAPYRMLNKEAEIFFLAQRLFPQVDLENQVLHCGEEEELMFQVLEHGVADLMALGEVQCTARFKSMNIMRRVKMSVGVSLSEGLLNLDIATQDISREELLEILKGYRSNRKYYRLKSGTFVNMEDDSIQMLQAMMESMHLSPKEFIKGKMHLPVYRTLYLDKLLEENESVYSNRDAHFREMVKNFKTVNDADFEIPETLTEIMRGYQRNGFKWMKTLEQYGFGGILADDMGLGKTLQMIAVLLAAKESGQKGTSLIVSPASLVYNWQEEFSKFAPQLKVLPVTGTQEARQEKLKSWQEYDVLVTSYDLLKRDIVRYEDMQFAYQVIDEAQYIKNHTTAASKAVKVIKSRMKYALTGTPIENRLSELWSIFDYLMPGFLYGYDVFRKEIEVPVAKNGDEETMKRLQKMTAPFILRRLKKDVLKDLPDKLEEIRYVQMDETQQRAYDAQVVQMQNQLSGVSGDDFNKNKLQILAELTRLRQICCDPHLCFSNYIGESAKKEACLELVQSAIDGGHKVLLFSQFTSMLDILRDGLDRMAIPYYVITGETPKEKRLQLVKSFNEDQVPVFLISLKAGGVGLNLTGADVVIHYDPWWNQAVQEQATDRAHRIGQTRKVTVYKLITRKTVEEKIQKLQEKKKDLADSIVNAQTGQFSALSREEFMELLS